MKIKERCENNELKILCDSAREYCKAKEIEKCKMMLYKSMSEYPDSPEPHNLLGIVLELTGNHILAMKHFRASWALDPTYKPANQNLLVGGTFDSNKTFAFDYSDLLDEKEQCNNAEIFIDEKGIKHIGNKSKILYNEYGLGYLNRR